MSFVSQCREMVDAVSFMSGVTTEIVGVWVWAWGNTEPYEALFKSLGWHFAPSKNKWCWHPPEVTYHEKHTAYSEIQNTYGVSFHKEAEDVDF